MMQSLVIPVLPEIQAQLGTDQESVTWVMTSYLLSASVFTPIVGRIGDRVGKERALVVTLVVIALGSLLAGLADSLGVMVVARLVQGAGGGVIPLSFGIVRDEVPPERLAGAISVLSSITAIGVGGGVVLAGPVVALLDYHWLFWLPMLGTAATAVAAALIIPPSPVRHAGRISVLPAVLLSGTLVALLLAVSQGNRWGWASNGVLGLGALAVLLAAAWVRVELRAASPLIDLRMMRLPAVWPVNLIAFLTGITMYSSVTFVPQLLQTPTSAGYGFGTSITGAGLVMLPSQVATFVVSLAGALLVRRLGARAVVAGGSLLATASMLVIALAPTSLWQVVLANVLIGLALGLVLTSIANVVLVAVPASQTGVAVGMNTNIRTIGGSVGTAVMASLVTAPGLVAGLPLEAGYRLGFALLSAAGVLAALVALRLPRAVAARAAAPV